MQFKNFYFIFFIAFHFSYAQRIDTFIKKTDAFLKENVNKNKVNYESIKKNDTDLNALVKIIAKFDLTNENEQNKKAFFINAYNILIINAIVAKYPVKSPLDIHGIFDKTKHEIANTTFTLNDIENKMLREKYNDSRIHFVLVCGANGCPPITNFAYTPENLDKQLDKQTRLAINNPNFIQINSKQKKVEVSQIFEWYSKDFITKNSNLIDFLNQYLNKPIDNTYKLSFYGYDWTLNKK